MLAALMWGGLAAASLLIGFALAGRGLSHRTIGLIMGVGSGALIAAIAYELVPESVLGAPGVGLAAIAGALTFYAGDWWVDRRGGAHRTDIAAGAMLTMLADAMMPEALEHGGKSVGLATALGFLATAALSILE